jgi:hypothetical protein
LCIYDNPVRQFAVDICEFFRAGLDHDGDVLRLIAIEITNDEVPIAFSINSDSPPVNALNNLAHLRGLGRRQNDWLADRPVLSLRRRRGRYDRGLPDRRLLALGTA